MMEGDGWGDPKQFVLDADHTRTSCAAAGHNHGGSASKIF